jgi:predicted DNA-binding transcriptional regulator YafY
VERRLVLAAIGKRPVRVTYLSLSEGEEKPRVIVPHAFGWDGRRWHTRAWDQGHEEWRDYVLGRFEKISWPQEETVKGLPKDEEWECWETVNLQVNPKLSEKAKAGIRLDYGLENDVLEMEVRKAMKPYLLAELFIEEGKTKELPRHFIQVRPPALTANR